MKNFKLFLFLLILLIFPGYSYSASLGFLRISYVEGDVQIQTEDTGDWVLASINTPLREGDRVWVPEGSRAELQLRDGTALRLDQESALDILAMDKDSFQFYLTEGRIYANFAGMRGSLLQIDAPLSSVRSYDKSIFRVDISRDGYTDIWVYKGSVDAENREGRTRVSQGNTLSLKEGTYAELSSMGPSDEWERWNTERNRRFAERPPSRYLPDELYAYSGDFEQNGRWVSVQEYGYVWTPRAVAVGWAPYRIGRWVWVGGEYVWISHEPWGWVPYHYGRWAFVSSVGWCWVPPRRGAVYWGPGFVGWVNTPTHVSWVPLAPGEIYYGRGYYGPHSVNITQININTIQVNKIVYKNIHVHNAVTVVHHDTFVRGKHVEVKVKENLFLKERISIGGPAIRPERATLMPVVKEIPERRRPPALIREIKIKGIKEKRPLIRERERSVLRPESPLREMPVKPREGKLKEREVGREREKPREFKPERRIEEEKESRPSERGIEKPRERGLEKPGPVEKRIERERESRPSERRIEKEREMKLQEKGGERRIEREKGEKPRRRGDERGVEKD